MHSVPESIVIARDIYKQIGSPGRPVAVAKVVAYAERVMSASTGRPYTIQAKKVAMTRVECRGALSRGPHECTIIVSNDLNDCWTRFVVCKEIMHLIVDTSPQQYATSMVAQAREAVEMTWPKDKGEVLSSERSAAVAAFELLYPWDIRSRLVSPPAALYDEAKEFMIPERYLDVYFKLEYGEISEEINAQIP